MMDTLHCELRVVGALLKRLLEEILESESSQKGSENKANEFAKLVSELTKNRGGFTISVEKGKIKKCSINNNNSGRAFVENHCYIKIVDEFLGDLHPQQKIEILELWDTYKCLLPHFRRVTDFTFEEKADFAKQQSKFYKLYVHRYGDEKVTNYIHYLGARHPSEFVEMYGCIGRFSNQGSEGMYKFTIYRIFRNTS